MNQLYGENTLKKFSRNYEKDIHDEIIWDLIVKIKKLGLEFKQPSWFSKLFQALISFIWTNEESRCYNLQHLIQAALKLDTQDRPYPKKIANKFEEFKNNLKKKDQKLNIDPNRKSLAKSQDENEQDKDNNQEQVNDEKDELLDEEVDSRTEANNSKQKGIQEIESENQNTDQKEPEKLSIDPENSIVL